MCNCHSYNWDNPDSGKEQNVMLNPKEYFPFQGEERLVCVDKCIAHVIRHLWKNNVWTLNSCCGHNKLEPSVVFTQNLKDEDAENIRRIIAEVDDRKFDILSWKLCKL